MVSGPRILYVVSSWPRGREFGGQLRALHIGRALKQVGDVTLTMISSEANDLESRRQTSEEFTIRDTVCPQHLPNRGFVQKLRWALDVRYLNLHGVAASADDRKRVMASFHDYDLIWVLNARTANILQLWQWPHAHLDIDDIPSTYLRGVAHSKSNAFGRLRSSVQAFLWKRRELLYRQRFSTLSVCSEADKAYLGGGDHIHVLPNGFVRPSSEPQRNVAQTPPRLGFIGLFSHAPNLDGVRWFLRECWPLIRKQIPGIRFRLAGKETDGALAPSDPDVDILGWIADPAAEIATWSAMVIPIRFGGGTRIKIADAFSRKCPVVSTGIGAFGYEVRDKRHLRLADTPEAFAQACVDLVNDQIAAAAMAETAWSAFLQHWTWDAITPRVVAAAEDCLRRNGRLRAG